MGEMRGEIVTNDHNEPTWKIGPTPTQPTELRDWFAKHFPKVNTPIIKPRASWVDDPEMRAKVAANGDAAILGVGL